MTRGARGRKLPSPDEGTVELTKGQEDMSMSSDVLMSGEDKAAGAAVRKANAAHQQK